jgi:CBS domain-containing protein
MENRARGENGLPNKQKDTGPLSPTGTLAPGEPPLIRGATPAEGEPGDARPIERRPTFRRMSYVGGDSPGWGRGNAGRPPGFGTAEYGSDFDERERERDTWREGESRRWRTDEPPYGAPYREGRAQDRPPLRMHDRSDGAGRHDRHDRKRSSWWQRESLTVADVMTSNVKAVGPDASVRDIAEIMKQEDVGVVPVVRADGRLVGLVTDRDLVIRGLTGGNSLENARAEALATTDIEVAAPRDPLSAIIDLMGRQQIRRVPVIDEDDRLVGIVAMADIANRADYHDDLQEALEKISGRRSFWSRIWR